MRGDEEPCLPRNSLAALQRTGRICPRVELDPENVHIAPLAQLALQPERFGWALQLLINLVPLHGQQRVDLVWRIITAVSSEGVTFRIDSKRREAQAKAEQQAKARAASRRRIGRR